jgi:hypothetical protein
MEEEYYLKGDKCFNQVSKSRVNGFPVLAGSCKGDESLTVSVARLLSPALGVVFDKVCSVICTSLTGYSVHKS